MIASSANPLALVVGVGAATGEAVCDALAADFRLAMVARSTRVIDALANNYEHATAYPCDVVDRDGWIATLRSIVENMGQPEYVLINTEGGGWGDYTQIDGADFSNSFEVNVVSLLTLIQTLFPKGARQPPCRIVINSSPAAYVSHPMFLGIAPSRAAQRVLVETLDAAMDRVEFSILSIDGAIDEPKMRRAYPERPTESFIAPRDIAAKVKALFEQEVLVKSEIIRARGDSKGIPLD